ncbi:MAG: hypothetical protein SOH48_07740 [Eubacteriales bacterium]
MAFNPMNLMKMKGRYQTFKQQHPKFMPFLKACESSAVEDAVLELSITAPGGEKKTANIKLTADDITTLNMLLGKKR